MNTQRNPLFTPRNLRSNPVERLQLAHRAKQCVDWLFVSGFEVLQVQKGLDKPRVFIRNSPLCKQLDGAVHRFERSNGIERRYWFAIRFDCEIRWDSESMQAVLSGEVKP